jgi:D-serine deaminase-like pyridoxal phosphate-dependent protein
MACKKKGSSKKCNPKKTTAKKKLPVKKTAATTDTAQVLTIVNRFKKGVNVATLKERTSFADKKIRNILYRATKQQKIKRVGQGLYAKA